jgi:hypothetical protein
MRLSAVLIVTSLLGGVISSCGAKAEKLDGIEGNTNWLRFCVADADCAEGLSCLCNRCTARCSADAECSALGAPALVCTSSSGPSSQCAAAESGVCTRSCTIDEDCGNGLICSSGVCLAASSPSEPLPIAVPDAGAPDDPEPPFVAPARCTAEDPVEPCALEATVYGLVDGRCVAIQDCRSPRLPDNRFFFLEECLSVCEGRPLAGRPCPAGTEPRSNLCIDCGTSGGCSNEEPGEYCAIQCSDDSQCRFATRACVGGVCQASGCE